MEISVRHVGNVAIFDISGDIDLASSPELRKALLREIRERRAPRVVVNLLAVRHMDSSGVASMIEALKASRDSGKRFAMFGMNAMVSEVFRISRLTTFFEIHASEDEALAP